MTSLLRQRLLDAMVLSGKADRTQEAYIGAVFGLARHYHRSPDTLSADEVQRYLLHLVRERHLSRSSVNQYSCAFRFLYGRVLGLDGLAFQIPLAPAPQRLPEILSREQIAALLEHAPHLKARTLLSCAYALGLRQGHERGPFPLSELCALRPEHIDSAADRMCVRVVQGKGARDRYVPLSADCSRCCAATGRPSGREAGCSRPRATRAAPWTSRARSAGTTWPATPPASPSAAASTPCATAMRHTCWRPGTTCTACRSGWATAT